KKTSPFRKQSEGRSPETRYSAEGYPHSGCPSSPCLSLGGPDSRLKENSPQQ
ncbi:hypothetical protein KUCAC02_035714, partial [Chaenocephalus aceratus]